MREKCIEIAQSNLHLQNPSKARRAKRHHSLEINGWLSSADVSRKKIHRDAVSDINVNAEEVVIHSIATCFNELWKAFCSIAVMSMK